MAVETVDRRVFGCAIANGAASGLSASGYRLRESTATDAERRLAVDAIELPGRQRRTSRPQATPVRSTKSDTAGGDDGIVRGATRAPAVGG
jgi:hypothetical protein